VKNVRVRYFAAFREAAGVDEERLQTDALTLEDLYAELRIRHGFQLQPSMLSAARNLELTQLSSNLMDGDDVVFLPPVAGG
jgi:sulfur-carrier protein